ncbi:hypothetical protein AU381_22925 [Sinorhizobium glycinis]|uniref:Uncharacterized protein n=1 Tax=Sinorhizobium glycinis TaxID=1472378 RepID=A0A178XV92_9HYPH|nr:hypothetical protein [Sinorhizobium glycinis]OAP38425.1 hypothetical protein AU381_22925 [Sinorhizobium glycinis]
MEEAKKGADAVGFSMIFPSEAFVAGSVLSRRQTDLARLHSSQLYVLFRSCRNWTGMFPRLLQFREAAAFSEHSLPAPVNNGDRPEHRWRGRIGRNGRALR